MRGGADGLNGPGYYSVGRTDEVGELARRLDAAGLLERRRRRPVIALERREGRIRKAVEGTAVNGNHRLHRICPLMCALTTNDAGTRLVARTRLLPT